ncbi:hypothetical protein AVEN_2497-1 [Araneus ventricosus]|uniref:Uncharacterized protein n=1 Tax=Araneus ventricosus TaxID=182803 RepID=A0A4Y2GED2_ARAVE|nr:hypothetical protein AVEN_2497-1 [Araneus ventricosus]
MSSSSAQPYEHWMTYEVLRGCLVLTSVLQFSAFSVLYFGLGRSFIWSYLVADVSDPIIGADFLELFELLIDVRNRRLLDGRTSLFVEGMVKRTESLGLTLVANNSPFHSILLKYPNLFPTNLDPNKKKTQLHIALKQKVLLFMLERDV